MLPYIYVCVCYSAYFPHTEIFKYLLLFYRLKFYLSVQTQHHGVGEMELQLRTFAILPEDRIWMAAPIPGSS